MPWMCASGYIWRGGGKTAGWLEDSRTVGTTMFVPTILHIWGHQSPPRCKRCSSHRNRLTRTTGGTWRGRTSGFGWSCKAGMMWIIQRVRSTSEIFRVFPGVGKWFFLQHNSTRIRMRSWWSLSCHFHDMLQRSEGARSRNPQRNQTFCCPLRRPILWKLWSRVPMIKIYQDCGWQMIPSSIICRVGAVGIEWYSMCRSNSKYIRYSRLLSSGRSQIWNSPMRFIEIPSMPWRTGHYVTIGLFTISTWPSFGPELGLLSTGPEGWAQRWNMMELFINVHQCSSTSRTYQFTSRFINSWETF